MGVVLRRSLHDIQNILVGCCLKKDINEINNVLV